MPITKTAKRALRSSKRKQGVNKKIITHLEIAIRTAKKSKKQSDVTLAMSLTDRATKKNVFHKNKSARIKSSLSKLLVTRPTVKVNKAPKKSKK